MSTDGSVAPSAMEFRQLMGHFASGVTVISAVDEGGAVAGMTASAVAAVSLEPPLLLVCVNKRDPLHQIMEQASFFAVNVLAEGQEHLSTRFASRMDRLADVPYQRGPGGVPLLADVVAHVICRPWKALPGGDHTIFIGHVTGGSSWPRRPLLHYRGAYTALRNPE